MATYLFLVNPTLAYNPYPDWAKWARLIRRGGRPATTWNTGNRRRGMAPGDRALIVKVGVEPRGLVAVGTLTSGIRVGPHWNPEARSPETGFVDLDIDVLIDLDRPIELDELALLAPGVRFTPRQSGTQVPEEAAASVIRAAQDPDQLGSLVVNRAK